MDKIHNLDWIYVDRGYGEMQLEQLHLYGKNHPETGLHKKVIGVSFSEKVSVRDPYTKKKDMKDVKPFMVNSSVNLFEKGLVAIDPKDMQLKEQFEQYRIKGISPNGRPTYTDENEHYVDAFNLCVLGFMQQYDSMMRVQLAKRVSAFSSLDKILASGEGTTLATGLDASSLRSDAIDGEKKKEKDRFVTSSTSSVQTIKKLGFVKNKRGPSKTGRSKF